MLLKSATFCHCPCTGCNCHGSWLLRIGTVFYLLVEEERDKSVLWKWLCLCSPWFSLYVYCPVCICDEAFLLDVIGLLTWWSYRIRPSFRIWNSLLMAASCICCSGWSLNKSFLNNQRAIFLCSQSYLSLCKSKFFIKCFKWLYPRINTSTECGGSNSSFEWFFFDVSGFPEFIVDFPTCLFSDSVHLSLLFISGELLKFIRRLKLFQFDFYCFPCFLFTVLRSCLPSRSGSHSWFSQNSWLSLTKILDGLISRKLIISRIWSLNYEATRRLNGSVSSIFLNSFFYLLLYLLRQRNHLAQNHTWIFIRQCICRPFTEAKKFSDVCRSLT